VGNPKHDPESSSGLNSYVPTQSHWCHSEQCHPELVSGLFRNPKTEMLNQVQHDNMGEFGVLGLFRI